MRYRDLKYKSEYIGNRMLEEHFVMKVSIALVKVSRLEESSSLDSPLEGGVVQRVLELFMLNTEKGDLHMYNLRK
ncbi:Uncharacterized protein TCM_013866 [Theobroma cacao]|uniref:Uncharacterized protein n=1 Tax=Theobroma cacao TaxID=3641 RepID=A0A061FXI6_THECC|nr:Uncharacterized protein TCM_013866 [Theobroma cacao]